MKQEFLDRLRGVDIIQAELRVKGKGYEAYVVPEGCAITMILRPNTVILWQKDEKVTMAEAGNIDELES
jgi:hypothetical protein